jgi:hypothetical protein
VACGLGLGRGRLARGDHGSVVFDVGNIVFIVWFRKNDDVTFTYACSLGSKISINIHFLKDVLVSFSSWKLVSKEEMILVGFS